MKAIVIQPELLDHTLKFSLMLPSHENWMNPESLFQGQLIIA